MYLRSEQDLDVVLRCLVSLRETAPGVDVLVVDDASPATALADLIEAARIAGRRRRREIGAGAALGPRCTLVAHAGVVIGAGAQLEEGTVIVDFDHVIDDVEQPIRAQPLEATAVTIGAGARIGLGASVLRGVTVGAQATVGPHAVVTRDVAPGASVGGVPARLL